MMGRLSVPTAGGLLVPHTPPLLSQTRQNPRMTIFIISDYDRQGGQVASN
jgi:hypothetical protein